MTKMATMPLTNSNVNNKLLCNITIPSTNINTNSQHYNHDNNTITGCSGALDLAISVIINEGDNLLVPVPGFPLYQVIKDSLGGSVRHYPLIPEKDWECDLVKMEEVIDARTKAILIKNPSNPCGSNFSKEHLEGIVAVASRHGLPIIADEIYGGCVFNGEFTPIHEVRQNVPVLTMGGLAKEFVVPGWRAGWVVLHDCMTDPPRLGEVRAG